MLWESPSAGPISSEVLTPIRFGLRSLTNAASVDAGAKMSYAPDCSIRYPPGPSAAVCEDVVAGARHVAAPEILAERLRRFSFTATIHMSMPCARMARGSTCSNLSSRIWRCISHRRRASCASTMDTASSASAETAHALEKVPEGVMGSSPQ